VHCRKAPRDPGKVCHPLQDTPKQFNMEMLFCYEPLISKERHQQQEGITGDFGGGGGWCD
jgi:hypothetical protein